MIYGKNPGLKSFLVGLIAALALVAFYFFLVSLSSRSWRHSLDLLSQDRFYVLAIAAGFGTQVGLYSYIRRWQKFSRAGSAGAVAASGTGTSTVSMVACCLHHLGELLPVIGASGFAIFLERYRYPVMWLGITINLLGIYLMLRLIATNNIWPSRVLKK
ncbi:Uncharacterized [Moorella glycerini]|uniref:Uncharacterized protein n=1 Tax=Neomoorella stamsii TaxID=1266720 RepID=A0A9X7J010_9FIRM|nr:MULTISPECIES: hypothetical protein [Moorella]PRR68887.1 hypothetical protein MOST_31690 [Moorella stamsii]CEP67508.1 Uncharacterized [Moorella glycerini]